MTDKYNGELQKGIALITGGSFFLLVSLFIRFYMIPYTIKGTKNITAKANDPTLFPDVFNYCLMAFAVAILISGIVQCSRHKQHWNKENVGTEWKHMALLDAIPTLTFSMLGVLFCVLVPYLGFFVTCWVVTFLATLYLKNRTWTTLIVFPIAVTATIYIIFKVLLQVRFPSGWLI